MADVRSPERETTSSPEAPYQVGFTWPRALAILAVVAMVAFWAWIFSGAPAKDNPDKLQDPAYVAALVKQCKAMRADLAELPNAEDITTQDQRADVLDDANVIVGRFIDDVAAGAPKTGDAAKSMKGWITDWRTYLTDREDFAKRLRTQDNAQLLLSRSTIGTDSVDKTIQIFTQVNEIPDCDTPGDVG